jgi:hypothetical protein
MQQRHIVPRNVLSYTEIYNHIIFRRTQGPKIKQSIRFYAISNRNEAVNTFFCLLNKTFEGTVAYLLKARTVEPEKQPLLGNVRTQQ